ncbi:MAG: LUD domain-containing protein [Actinomycetaceae bacterium]|nr:LUD domain-containing protein [Actinomycetaceae bacterium]MDY6082609.1 LUD domain-containing protein [Actinomycetaceae bacterium]
MPAAPTRHYRMSGAGDPGSDAVVAEMAQKLEDYTAVVRLVGVPDIPRAIDELLGDAHTVVVPRGLPQQWSAGAHGTSRVVTVDEPASPLSHDQLNRTDAVVTASRLGIASTGTIVLDGEPDQGRRALSLVPDIHVCVLRAKDIYELVPEAIAVLGENPQRPTTWIAGPSATSDIELVRVNGVHGPRNLRVVIVKDA